MSDYQIHGTYTRVGVNQSGSETNIPRAVFLDPDMTLEELLTTGLAYRINGELFVNDEDYITIRVAKKLS